MNRSRTSAFLASVLALSNMTLAVAEQPCRPILAIKDVRFSAMQPPTLERKWTATVSVDASAAPANAAGYFEIVLSRLKEIGPEVEFREPFIWLPPSVLVGTDFSDDEAV